MSDPRVRLPDLKKLRERCRQDMQHAPDWLCCTRARLSAGELLALLERIDTLERQKARLSEALDEACLTLTDIQESQ